MVKIKYQVLFKIIIQHDYYDDVAFDDLLIVPSVETALLLENYKILLRQNKNEIVLVINTSEDKPVIPLANQIYFRFYVSLKKPSLRSISSLKITADAGTLYYFSNKRGNKNNNRLYLSAPVSPYADSIAYEVGSIVKNGNRVFECIAANDAGNKNATTDQLFWRDIVIHQSKSLPDYAASKSYIPGDKVKDDFKMFECIRSNDASNKHGTSDAAFWSEITEIAYVSDADLVEDGLIATATLSDYDSSNTYNKGALTLSEGKFFEAMKSSSKADKHATTEAAFWKEVAVEYIKALMNFKLPPEIFAVIDIFNGLGESNDFTLPSTIDDDAVKTFYVRFKNRSTIWKYISRQNSVKSVTDKNAVYDFSNVAMSNEFVSSAPIPLSYKPLTTLELAAIINNRNVKISGLQNPVSSQLKMSGNPGDYKIFSEIYLNY